MEISSIISSFKLEEHLAVFTSEHKSDSFWEYVSMFQPGQVV